MIDKQRQEIMRRQAEGMRALSEYDMAQRQLEAAYGMRQRGPLTAGEQEAIRNFWGGTADEQNNFVPNPPPPTLVERFKRWLRP